MLTRSTGEAHLWYDPGLGEMGFFCGGRQNSHKQTEREIKTTFLPSSSQDIAVTQKHGQRPILTPFQTNQFIAHTCPVSEIKGQRVDRAGGDVCGSGGATSNSTDIEKSARNQSILPFEYETRRNANSGRRASGERVDLRGAETS